LRHTLKAYDLFPDPEAILCEGFHHLGSRFRLFWIHTDIDYS
jgi:hypothetical protein